MTIQLKSTGLVTKLLFTYLNVISFAFLFLFFAEIWIFMIVENVF